MITTDGIIKSVIDKIKFVSGDNIILETDFKEQYALLKNNFIDFVETIKANKDNISEQNFEDLTNPSSYRFSDESRKIFNQYFQPTNSFLEKEILNYSYYNLFEYFINNDSRLKQKYVDSYKDVLLGLDNIKKALISEGLENIKFFYINICDRDDISVLNDGIKNSQNSLRTLRDNRNNRFNNYAFIVYLLSSKRVLKLEVNHSRIYTEEHIIQKDIKKVTNSNTIVEFHYHGLHNPDKLYTDTFEEAVKLRKFVTEMRDYSPNFINRKN